MRAVVLALVLLFAGQATAKSNFITDPDWQSIEGRPLVVYMVDATPNLLDAVEYWNGVVGGDVLVPWREGLVPDVFVYNRDCGDSWYIAYAAPIRSETVKDKSMVMMCENHNWRFSTLVHELGHVLGLHHDNDNPKSVMAQLGAGRHFMGVEPVDVDYLRRRYLR